MGPGRLEITLELTEIEEKMMKTATTFKLIMGGLMMFGLLPLASAEQAVLPHSFASGTPAYAAEVNENFEAVKDAVNSKPEIMASLGYSVTPTVRGVTISNVRINGGAITAPVAPGSSIEVSLDYHIVDTGCPGCIDEIQIGFSHLQAEGCVYTGIPGSGGVSGSAHITLTAPSEPGTYYIGSDRAQDYACPSHWWNGAPTATGRWVAAITVQ